MSDEAKEAEEKEVKAKAKEKISEAEVVLIIDGKKIPLNSYVRSVFSRVISAMVSTLKGVDEDWKEVKIELKK